MATRPNEQPTIVIRKIKKISGGHHGGAWKVAYADFVTAMMAFFMLLWLISNPDKQQLKGLADYFTPAAPNAAASSAIGDAPGDNPGAGGRTVRSRTDSSAPSGQPSAETATAGVARGGTANVPDASMRVLAQELKMAIDSLPQGEDAKQNTKVEPSRDGVRINLMDSAKRSMFRGSTADLNDFARLMLREISGKLAKSGAMIAIEGHTDSLGGSSDGNWRLSGERALSARNAMAAAGITTDRFSEIVAKAGTEPVYPDQPERPENRRITIVVLGAAPSLPTDASFKF
ncbi:flagellar motor protein MotB [Sphingomonas mucosissima]|uniref:Motility protein B n=1 Tax=Sphingomonas mucosissima TaxID=370959 RepID=A0A245ZTN1_9SPHN|nr:flagellar motor protein MotB [Sphingomonas mucosissima]OWK33091.1 motility protein B [Sphingomonas mucosissima]